MAALLTHKSSIQKRHHGPELNAENAIRATDNFLGHKMPFGQTAKAKDTVRETLSPLPSPSVGNKLTVKSGPFVMAHLCQALARECHHGWFRPGGAVETTNHPR